ncbi:glycosyltransferase family 2 protein [uncultured Polaribacter sp.]|uniref:glycosyltransferase family 2 protein n=1 Tax=uncultured Polaribacter sp. TaxID=174711 RepID=UPI002625EA27|nr:glycosyltransferase family 2 protein [uncultured Polaribacter sp.]
MAAEKNNISIIIVNYKSWHHLQNCLDSIAKIDDDDFLLEVIIVDNSLNKIKIEEFKNNFPSFKFYINSGNNGFANGCNLGAKKASGNYFLFLNPDTKITKQPILEMLTVILAKKNLGAVSCLQKNEDGSYEKSMRFFPKLITLFGFFRAIFKTKLEKSIKKDTHIIYPDWISGAVVLISKNWFSKIKGWNEDYWMYFEDVDLSKKIRDKKGEIGLLTNTFIIHNHGGSSRINLKTASITKLEVLISKHVYFANHFKGIYCFLLQTLLVVYTMFSKFILGLLGLFFFFVPKLKLQFVLFKKIISYYFLAIINSTWLSEKSINYSKLSLLNKRKI